MAIIVMILIQFVLLLLRLLIKRKKNHGEPTGKISLKKRGSKTGDDEDLKKEKIILISLPCFSHSSKFISLLCPLSHRPHLVLAAQSITARRILTGLLQLFLAQS